MSHKVTKPDPDKPGREIVVGEYDDISEARQKVHKLIADSDSLKPHIFYIYPDGESPA